MQPIHALPPILAALAAAGCGYAPNTPSSPAAFDGQTVTAAVVTKTDRICGARPDASVLCIDSPPSIADAHSVWAPLGARTTRLPAPVARLASGGWNVCALLRDASVWCWADSYGPTGDAVEVASGVVDLAMSEGGLVCTVSRAGAVTCAGNEGTAVQSESYPGMGPDGLGPADLHLGEHEAKAISLGELRLAALVEDGTVETWDLDDVTASGTPLPGVADAIELSAGTGWIGGGGEHACVLLGDHSVRCWGANDTGQLGTGSISDEAATPQTVDGLTGVAQVVAGSSHTCARMTDGTVACWGASGQFAGSENQAEEGWYSAVPVPVPDVRDAVDLTTGTVVNCVLTSAGSLTCWGGAHDQGLQLGAGGGGAD